MGSWFSRTIGRFSNRQDDPHGAHAAESSTVEDQKPPAAVLSCISWSEFMDSQKPPADDHPGMYDS